MLGSLEEVSVEQVYRKGRLVNDAMFDRQAAPIAESMLHTVVLSGVSKDKIQVPARGKVPVIGMVSGQIVTKFLREEVPSCEGWFVPNREYSKLCVFERHRGTGNAKAAPLKDTGLQEEPLRLLWLMILITSLRLEIMMMIFSQRFR